MGWHRPAPGCVESEPRAHPSSEAGKWRQRPMGRASAAERWLAIAWARPPARSAETTEAAPARVAVGRARQAGARTRRQAAAGRARPVGVRTRRQAVADRARQAGARTPRVLRRGLGRRRQRAELLVLARRTRVAVPPWARPSPRTDSCPRANRSGRDPPLAREKSHRAQRGAGCSNPDQVGGRSREAPDRGLAEGAAAARAAARRSAGWGAPPARALPTRERAGAAAAREGELPRRLTGCRKTGKTCWWAGSRRRTACTRSCEKLPSSSDASLTCVGTRREHTRFTASLRS